MTQPSVAQDPIRGDFRNFLYLTWKHLGLPDPTPLQYEIAEFLQYGPKRLCVEAFRGVGKSWITSAFVPWNLLRNPQLNVLVVSASKNRADDFSTFTLRLIQEMPILQHLSPGDNQRSSKLAFDVGPAGASHMPSVKSLGITGQLTGSRADLIVADDIEVVNNSATQMMRERLEAQASEFEAILKPLEASRIVFLGTPQNEQSLYNLLPNKGYTVRIWPARMPEVRLVDALGDKLAPSITEKLETGVEPGIPTDPDRFGERELAEREMSYGRSGFALQFQLDTSLSDADRYPLKLSDLVVLATNPTEAPEKIIGGSGPELEWKDLESVGLHKDRYYRPAAVQGKWVPYQGSVMAIDPSGRGRDETAFCVVKMLNGYLYLLEAGGLLSGFEDETMNHLVQRAAFHNVNEVVIEANYGGGMFTSLIKPWFNKIHPVHIEEVTHSKQKELRIIDTLEPVMNQRKLIVDSKVIQADMVPREHLSPEQNQRYQLFYQMTRITRERACLVQDDRLDCLSIAVNYWTERLGQDVEKQIKLRNEAAVDREIQEFLSGTLGGGRVSEPNWIPGSR